MAEHYRNLMISFKKMVKYCKESYDDGVRYFRDALWSSSAAILLFSALVPRALIQDYPDYGDYLVVIVVAIALICGRYLYADE